MSNWQLSGVPFTTAAKVEHREHLISSIVYELFFLLCFLPFIDWLLFIMRKCVVRTATQEETKKRESMELNVMQLQWETCRSNRLTPTLFLLQKKTIKAQACSVQLYKRALGQRHIKRNQPARRSFTRSVTDSHLQPEMASRLDSNSFAVSDPIIRIWSSQDRIIPSCCCCCSVMQKMIYCFSLSLR